MGALAKFIILDWGIKLTICQSEIVHEKLPVSFNETFLKIFFWGIVIFSNYINTVSYDAPQIPLCAEIEPRTVATGALTVRHSNHKAKSHPH